MARAPRLFAPGIVYHVVARGNQRRLTFLDHEDYAFYLDRLTKYRARDKVSLYAYCLMPNHVHLLLRTSDIPLSKSMQAVQQSYTQRFNHRRRTVGHVFQGRYRAIVCETDIYLAALVRYIHLNPVRAGLVEDPGAYAYSSHRAYLSAEVSSPVETDLVLAMLGGRSGYHAFIQTGTTGGHDDHRTDHLHVVHGVAGAHESGQPEADGVRDVDLLPLTIAEMAGSLHVDPVALHVPRQRQLVAHTRALAFLVLTEKLGYSLSDVAALLGQDPVEVRATVARQVARLPEDG